MYFSKRYIWLNLFQRFIDLAPPFLKVEKVEKVHIWLNLFQRLIDLAQPFSKVH
jgi:hypothetical protein